MRITFAGPLVSTFVFNDLAILRTKYEVDAHDVMLGKGYAAALRLIRLHLALIASILKSDALFFWFADYYTLIPSLFARLLGKPVFVVAGGFDITYLPELGIGARTRPVRWFAVKNTFKVATHIFTVSQDTQNDLDNAVSDHAPSTMIYNAVDTGTYSYDRRQTANIVLTVSQADSEAEFRRKGIDRFLEIARSMPALQFRLVGVRGEVVSLARRLSEDLSNVVIKPGRVPLEELLEEFWSAPIYLQLSVEERFGVSVAEAMSCGCIPVISPVNAMMEVVGSHGYVVDRSDDTAIKHAITSALLAPETDHQAASVWAHKFDLSARANQLLQVVSKHLG